MPHKLEQFYNLYWNLETCRKVQKFFFLLPGPEDCPETCPSNYDPVCGNDGNNYQNECYLKNIKCLENKPDLSVDFEGLWQHRLWSFKSGDTQLERFLPKNQHTQRKLWNFENWCSGEVSKSLKICFSKSIYYVKNHQNLSQFFFIEYYQFRSIFFVFDIF